MEYVPDIDDYGQHDPGDFCLGLYLTFVIACEYPSFGRRLFLVFGAGFALCAFVFTLRILILRHKIRDSKRAITDMGGDPERPLTSEKRIEEGQ